MISIKNVNIFELKKRRSLIGKKFDFNLIYEKKNGLLKQKVTKELKKFLIKRYKSNQTNSSPMEKSKHRKKHGLRLFQLIKNNFKKSLSKKKVLEVGCGSGYLLKLFSKESSNVLGIEPSSNKHLEKKIKIEKSFYLDNKFKNKFDIIISNAVLEHEFNPDQFLKKSFNDLNYGGMNFTCVPGYSELIDNGDPTLINHEHISYFTKNSLKFYFIKNNFSKVKVFSDKFGNLYGIGFKKRKIEKFLRKKIIKKNQDKIYEKKLYKCLKNIDYWIDKNKSYNLGLYGATSAISTIFSKIKFNKKNIYIFDGDTQKQKKFVDTFPNPILDSKKIIKKNIKKIIVLPYFYEKEIKKFLIKKINFNSKNIKCLSNFF